MADRKGGLSAGVQATKPRTVDELSELRETTSPNVSALIEQRRTPVPNPTPAQFPFTTRENMKRITMIVTDDFHHRLKQLALDKRSTLEDLYREALKDLMLKYGRE